MDVLNVVNKFNCKINVTTDFKNSLRSTLGSKFKIFDI